MKKNLLVILALSLILASCTRAGQNTPVVTTPLPPSAAVKAQQSLADELGIDPNWITIKDAQAKQWSNSCLDAQASNEVCAQQITSGYLVVLVYGGKTYTYHTDLEGNQIREPQKEAVHSEAALQARQLLAGLLRYDPASILIVSEESVLFADSCLEIAIPETACAQVQIRGKRIVLEADKIQFEFRTADNPIAPKLAAASGVKGGDLVIMFSQEGGPDQACDNLNITLSGRAIQYSCRNVPGEVPGISELSEEDQSQLLRWMLEYTSYDITQTQQDGMKIRVTFNGTGTESPTFPEQETIREFCEGLLLTPPPFPTPLPTVGPEK